MDNSEETQKLCTNCAHYVPASKFELHESHCKRHMAACGVCGEVVAKREMDQHHQHYHAPVPCERCGKAVTRDELDDHLEHVCLEAMLECKYCELEVRRADYREHVEQCGSRTDFCELCNQRVMLKEMAEHREMKCGHNRAEAPLDPNTLHDLLDEEEEVEMNYHFLAEGHGSEGGDIDEQWLATVSDAYQGEDLDAVVAQNMFYENHRTRRDGHHGPFSRNTYYHVPFSDNEGHHGPFTDFGGHYGPFSGAIPHNGPCNDSVYHPEPMGGSSSEEVAIRLQDDLDNRTREEQSDREVARHIQEEEQEMSSYQLAHQLHQRDMEYQKQLESDARLARQLQEDPSDSSLAGGSDVTARQDHEEQSYQLAQQLHQREVNYQKQMQKDEELARLLQEEQPGYAHLDEQPRPKTPPIKDEVSCQRCNKLIPYDEISGHQTACYADFGVGHNYYGEASVRGSSPPPVSEASRDEELARKMQLEEDRQQYTHLNEQPRPKTPPPQEDDERVPCQWCNKLIPFSQISSHQTSCYADYGYAIPRHHYASVGEGKLKLTEEVLSRVNDEREELSSQVSASHCRCQYCKMLILKHILSSHQAICEKNPEQHLKNVYSSASAPLVLPSLQTSQSSQSHSSTGTPSQSLRAAAVSTSVEKGPCDYCGELVSLAQLVRHEARCSLRNHPPRKTAIPPNFPQPRATPHSKLAIRFPNSASDHLDNSGSSKLQVEASSSYKSGIVDSGVTVIPTGHYPTNQPNMLAGEHSSQGKVNSYHKPTLSSKDQLSSIHIITNTVPAQDPPPLPSRDTPPQQDEFTKPPSSHFGTTEALSSSTGDGLALSNADIGGKEEKLKEPHKVSPWQLPQASPRRPLHSGIPRPIANPKARPRNEHSRLVSRPPP